MVNHFLGLVLVRCALVTAQAPSRVQNVCDPEDGVCHGCMQICSQHGGQGREQVSDLKTELSTSCLADCRVAAEGCYEDTVAAPEKPGDHGLSRVGVHKCLQDTLSDFIRERGDVLMKILYDVPPTCEDFDQLYQEDGKIDKQDMAVFFDLLDGGALADGTAIPPAKASLVWETFREADENGDGVVTESECKAYGMGDPVEKDTPTPEYKSVAVQDLLQAQSRPKPMKRPVHLARKHSLRRHKQSHQAHSRLAYFQHLLRLGLRALRAEHKETHPITVLATKMLSKSAEVDQPMHKHIVHQ